MGRQEVQRIRIRRSSPAGRCARAAAIRRRFDLAPQASRLAIDVEVPAAGGRWRIGAIVGASGSGKSQVLAAAFDTWMRLQYCWPANRPIVDALACSADEAAAILSAVGLGSVPAWLRPYSSLSAGEQFRATLARELSAGRPLVAVDEFTSCLDRVVARSACAALSRYLRRTAGAPQLVVAACHEDIVPWLAPEWVLSMPSGRLDWRRLRRRPRLALEVRAGTRELWPHFAPHHYLTGRLHRAANCYAGLVDGRPAAFCATLPNAGRRAWRRVTRLVVHPDYQGLGIGVALLGAIAQHEAADGPRVSIVTGHPALVASLSRSPHWRELYRRAHRHPHRGLAHQAAEGGARLRVSFEFLRESCR